MIFKPLISVTAAQASFGGIHSISGNVTNLGAAYKDCEVRLYEKFTGLMVERTIPRIDNSYSFKSLKKCKFIVVAVDQKQQFNAVIQDNVVPK